MATKIGVELDLDPSGLQRGADAAAKSIDKIANNTQGIRKLDNVFKDMGITTIPGLQGTSARLADALLEFAPGGFVGSAVIAGIGAIALAMKGQSEEQKKIEEEQNKVTESARDQYLAYVKLAGGVELYNTELNKTEAIIARNDIKKFTEQLVKLEEKIRDDAVALQLFNTDMGAAGGRVMTQTAVENALAQARKGNLAEYLKALQGLQNANTAFANATSNQIQLEKDLSKTRSDAAKKLEQEQKAEQDRRFKLLMAYYDELQKARDLARQVTTGLISADVQAGLKEVDATIAEIAKRAQQGTLVPVDPEKMQEVSSIAETIANSFNIMGAALGQGANAFSAFGQAAKAAVGVALKAIGQKTLVQGLEQVALAIAAAATGGPLAAAAVAGHRASALKFFAASAAANVAAGAVGGFGGGAGGAAGGANRGFSASNLGNTQGQQGPITITIVGGNMLDMSNPQTANAFANAFSTLTSRRVILQPVGV